MTGSGPAIEWAVSEGLIDYPLALDAMKRRTSAIREGRARELIWLLEHPPIYTAGTGAKNADLIDPARLPVYNSGRGDQFTYHGPGPTGRLRDARPQGAGNECPGARNSVESWVIEALAEFNVIGETRPDRIGVWVRRPTPSADGRGEDCGDRLAGQPLDLKPRH